PPRGAAPSSCRRTKPFGDDSTSWTPRRSREFPTSPEKMATPSRPASTPVGRAEEPGRGQVDEPGLLGLDVDDQDAVDEEHVLRDSLGGPVAERAGQVLAVGRPADVLGEAVVPFLVDLDALLAVDVGDPDAAVDPSVVLPSVHPRVGDAAAVGGEAGVE